MKAEHTASGVEAGAVVDAIAEIGTTHIVIVPDTHQRTVLELLDARDATPVVRAATEDDVLGICAGLWMAGHRPLAVIQQLGLFASANALRAFTHDQRVPMPILAGVYGRDVSCSLDDPSQGSAIRLCTPLLDALDIRWTLIDAHGDAPRIAPALRMAYEESCTSVALLGAPTT